MSDAGDSTRDRSSNEHVPDAVLVARVQGGDSSAFAILVRRYQRALERVARSRLGRQHWAEEVVQETFLAAFRWCSSYDPAHSFRTWLWNILLNQCHQHYRRRMRGVTLEPLAAAHEPADAARAGDAAAPLERLLAKERSEQLEALLLQLSAVQADALRLRFFGGLKFQEIADAMQCSLSTAKNRVQWGLTRMAELLQADAAQARRDLDGERDA